MPYTTLEATEQARKAVVRSIMERTQLSEPDATQYVAKYLDQVTASDDGAVTFTLRDGSTTTRSGAFADDIIAGEPELQKAITDKFIREQHKRAASKANVFRDRAR